ncbi:TPA: hypothetical protein ACGRVN_001391 [Escherichia coli]
MMSTPFYKVRQLASSSGWQLRFEGCSDWLPIAATEHLLRRWWQAATRLSQREE